MQLRLPALLALLLLAARFAHAAIAPGPAPAGSSACDLITAPDGSVYLTWCESEAHAVRLARLAKGAETWSEPRTIAATPHLFVNWADTPTLAVGSDGALTAHWAQTKPGSPGPDYSGWFARSTDGGATWTKAAPLGQEFTRLVAVEEGRVLAVWLQHLPGAGETPAAGQPAVELRARLLAADGRTIQDWRVDPDVCTCCQLGAARLSGDRVFLVYRGHDAQDVRDNQFRVLGGSVWTLPKPLHADGWKLNACPVNGPVVAAHGEHVAVAWFTAAQGARIRAKYSRDGGLTFTEPVVIDQGRPLGRLGATMLADGSAVVAWLEAGASSAEPAAVMVRRLFPDGKMSAALRLAQTGAGRASGWPRVAARHGAERNVVLAWTETGATTQVRTLEFSAAELKHLDGEAAATASLRDFGVRPELCEIKSAAPAGTH